MPIFANMKKIVFAVIAMLALGLQGAKAQTGDAPDGDKDKD